MCEEPEKLNKRQEKENMTAVEWNSSLRRFTCENDVELHLHVVQLCFYFTQAGALCRPQQSKQWGENLCGRQVVDESRC